MNRAPVVNAARILDTEARRAHHKLAVELGILAGIMALSVMLAGWRGSAVNLPYVLQSIIVHRYRL